MSGDIAGRIATFLDGHRVMSLATCGVRGPHAANLFYARDGLSLVWVSDPQSRHSLALEADPRASATVAPDYRDFEEIRGLQISGDAHRLTDAEESRRARSLLEARYPFLRRLAEQPSLKEAYETAVPYRLVPHEIVMIDNTRGFGHKDTLDLRASRHVDQKIGG